MLYRPAVDDPRLVVEAERRDRRPHLLRTRRGGDRPRDAGAVEPTQGVLGTWKRLRVAVVRVEGDAGATIEVASRLAIDRSSCGLGNLLGEPNAIHPDHRPQLVARGGDAELVERRLPRRNARLDCVDEGAVEVEDDGLRSQSRSHAPYDTEPMPSELAVHWTLDPSIAFLNHGSFGATPRPVLDAQSAWRDRMEREPVAFFTHDLEPALDAARAELGRFVGGDPDDLAFVVNATAGINTVARGIALEPGDEVIVLDHAYNAARNALVTAAASGGARVVTAAIPFPGTAPDDAMAAILTAVTKRTRLVLLDHVTSPTALVLPVAEIVAALDARGIDTLVDGAHAPGMIEVDVDRLGAAYYTANCHKWMCAPKGSGFLHVRRDRQDRIRPLVISHGANSPRTDRTRFRLEHDWTGTLDPSAWLAVPAAIGFGATVVPGGWAELRARGHRLALEGRAELTRVLGTDMPAPDEMIGSMAAVPMPSSGRSEPPVAEPDEDPVHAALLAAGVQVAVTAWPRDPGGGAWGRLIRFSCAPYVDATDLGRLVAALAALRVAV